MATTARWFLEAGAPAIHFFSSSHSFRIYAKTVDVNARLAQCVQKSGDRMTGLLRMNDNYITVVRSPGTDPSDAANKEYVDTLGPEFIEACVRKTGDNMTGPLSVVPSRPGYAIVIENTGNAHDGVQMLAGTAGFMTAARF